ncbi:hypothetical protein SUGI_0711510 [Cryptomeria japonica]|uniref:uncharacterized protein LOC131033929 isoform X2 n=1 Tax=Cryptomeria japonica TaxID=3369 RepID=UPI0024148231|nr:uncharacterized protein LOC131033929 isoform X2 [Cryptomeria japonica]GLJ35379.1 hypothetical protein SUGI_0711510 [Cryptomeria japonica]
MASTQSSAQSSPTISQLIDQIINTKQDAPDFDLDQLIANIDRFLALCRASQGKNSKSEKSTVDWLSSASDTAKISEGVSENINILAKEISEYSGKEHSTAISVLRAAGNVHWAGLCLLLVAAVLNRVDTINKNKMECLDLLNSMNELAKVVRKLKEIPRAKDEMLTQINESIALIVQGAILCFSQKKTKRFKRFLNASKDKDDLVALRSKVEEMYRSLDLHISLQSLSVLENSRICNQPRIHSVEYAVGIQKQIDEVVKRLKWESDSPSIAVVVHGIGGSGKTTLADAVYHSLRDKLNGWKYSKITLPQYLKDYPLVKELQSFILEDLTGKKEDVRDSESGRQRLKELMEKESIFLYIDNALFREPLQQLLPRDITNPKKLRLLLTARKTNISDVMEDCRIKYEIYPIEPLSLDAAIQVLRGKIVPNRDTNSLSKERPEVEVIAQKCSSCPLFLEVVGGFLRRRRNEDEAYERVLQWMENGEPFSGDREDRFDEQRIMFAYDQLEPNAQEAFLDICSFFYGWHWDWEEIARIVGKVEMECLEEGALIKRKKERSEDGRIITKISIHDLLLSVGCKKSKNNRFKTLEESTKALQNDKLLPQIKGVWLTNKRYFFRGVHSASYREEFLGPIHVPAEVLDAMSGSLRVFAMGKWTLVKGKCSKSFDELRFLQADGVSNLPMDISKLSSLSYIECSLEGNIKLSELKDLSALKVVNVSKPPDSWNSNEISEVGYGNKLWKLALKGFCGTGLSNLVNLGYLRKLQLSQCDNLTELTKSLGKLSLLEELYLDGCKSLKQLPVGFGKLTALAVLNLNGCESLQELPLDFVNLSSLQYLDLSYCKSLQELPSNFEKLTSLQYLNLSCCSKLIRLPEGLGYLQCLTEIYFSSCEKLSSLPQSLGGLSSLLMSEMSFDKCSCLTKLPEETSWLSGMTRISFENCSRLKRIPFQFSKLTCLEILNLEGCESIEELFNDFLGLEVLRTLVMRRCRSLSTLPQGFAKLEGLQILHLSECDKLEELCGDFHCLGALKTLDLSTCCSLTKLPNLFGQLGCLENADLSGCSNLAELCDDFHTLPSLIRLNLSNCKRLGAEWMDRVGATQSLLYVDISGSEGMTQRWTEMQREKEEWHLVVVTDSSSKDTERTVWPLLLEKIIWKIFRKAGLLIDAQQRPFYSSSLPSHARLILITQSYGVSPETWRLVESNLERLECNSKELAIIYVGKEFDALPSELADRIVAHSPFHSFINNFYDVLPKSYSSIGVFASTIDGVERNTVKYLSTWEDISYISDEVEFLARNPSESNVQLLRKLCETQENDFFLRNGEQVKVKDLEGKVVLLFKQYSFPMEKVETSALKDVYVKLQSSSDYRAEVVCIPQMWSHSNPEDYERAATSAPWPMVHNPWLINTHYWTNCVGYGNGLVVVDEKGSISHKDAMSMILRWGIKAYPFSESQEEELRKAEWKEFNFSSQTSLEFIFQNFEFFQSRATKAIIRGQMIFLCVGPIDKMLEFLPQLNDTLPKLENVIQVLYVGEEYLSQEEKEYEMKRKEMCSITSLSWYDVYKFWKRVKCLWDELGRQGVDEKTVQVRQMVWAIVTTLQREIGAEVDEKGKGKGKGISIIVVDENGEMVNGSDEEIVQLLCHSDGGSD